MTKVDEQKQYTSGSDNDSDSSEDNNDQIMCKMVRKRSTSQDFQHFESSIKKNKQTMRAQHMTEFIVHPTNISNFTSLAPAKTTKTTFPSNQTGARTTNGPSAFTPIKRGVDSVIKMHTDFLKSEKDNGDDFIIEFNQICDQVTDFNDNDSLLNDDDLINGLSIPCSHYLSNLEKVVEYIVDVKNNKETRLELPEEVNLKPIRSIDSWKNQYYENVLEKFESKHEFLKCAKERAFGLLDNLWIFKEKPIYEFNYCYSQTSKEVTNFANTNKVIASNSWSNCLLINQFSHFMISTYDLQSRANSTLKFLDHEDHGWYFSCCTYLDKH